MEEKVRVFNSIDEFKNYIKDFSLDWGEPIDVGDYLVMQNNRGVLVALELNEMTATYYNMGEPKSIPTEALIGLAKHFVDEMQVGIAEKVCEFIVERNNNSAIKTFPYYCDLWYYGFDSGIECTVFPIYEMPLEHKLSLMWNDIEGHNSTTKPFISNRLEFLLLQYKKGFYSLRDAAESLQDIICNNTLLGAIYSNLKNLCSDFEFQPKGSADVSEDNLEKVSLEIMKLITNTFDCKLMKSI